MACTRSITGGALESIALARNRIIQEKNRYGVIKFGINFGVTLIAIPLTLIVLAETVIRAVVQIFVWITAKLLFLCHQPHVQKLYDQFFSSSIEKGGIGVKTGLKLLFLSWLCSTPFTIPGLSKPKEKKLSRGKSSNKEKATRKPKMSSKKKRSLTPPSSHSRVLSPLVVTESQSSALAPSPIIAPRIRRSSSIYEQLPADIVARTCQSGDVVVVLVKLKEFASWGDPGMKSLLQDVQKKIHEHSIPKVKALIKTLNFDVINLPRLFSAIEEVGEGSPAMVLASNLLAIKQLIVPEQQTIIDKVKKKEIPVFIRVLRALFARGRINFWDNDKKTRKEIRLWIYDSIKNYNKALEQALSIGVFRKSSVEECLEDCISFLGISPTPELNEAFRAIYEVLCGPEIQDKGAVAIPVSLVLNEIRIQVPI